MGGGKNMRNLAWSFVLTFTAVFLAIFGVALNVILNVPLEIVFIITAAAITILYLISFLDPTTRKKEWC